MGLRMIKIGISKYEIILSSIIDRSSIEYVCWNLIVPFYGGATIVGLIKPNYQAH